MIPSARSPRIPEHLSDVNLYSKQISNRNAVVWLVIIHSSFFTDRHTRYPIILCIVDV